MFKADSDAVEQGIRGCYSLRIAKAEFVEILIGGDAGVPQQGSHHLGAAEAHVRGATGRIDPPLDPPLIQHFLQDGDAFGVTVDQRAVKIEDEDFFHKDLLKSMERRVHP